MTNLSDKVETASVDDHLKADDVVNFYDKWADTYDKDIETSYRGPSALADIMCSLFDQSRRKSLEILDIGAGSGLVSQKLQPMGFVNIDALEPASNMLQIAKDRGLYRNYYNTIIDEESLTERNGFYDCVLCCGCVTPNHIRSGAFKDLARLSKQDGYVVIVMRRSFGQEFNDTLHSEIRQLEDQGKWRMESEQVIDNYYYEEQGTTFVFKVLK